MGTGDLRSLDWRPLGAAVAGIAASLALFGSKVDLPSVVAASVVAMLLLGVSSYGLLCLAVACSTLTVYRWDVAGVGQLSPYRLFLLLALVSLLVGRLKKGTLNVDIIFAILLGMCVWDLVGASYSPRPSIGLQVGLQELEYSLTWLIIVNTVRTTRRVQGVLLAFLTSVVVALGLTTWQWLNVFVWKRPFHWPLWEYTRLPARAGLLAIVGTRDASLPYDRVSSVLGDSINFANLAAVGICVAVCGLFLFRRNALPWRMRLALWATLLTAPLLLLASGSRGGPLALVLGLAFGGVALRRRFMRRRVLISAGAALMLALLLLEVPSLLGYQKSLVGMYVGRLEDDLQRVTTNAGSIGGRFFAQADAVSIWVAHPVLGIGEGGLPNGTHGQLADNLAENGILGGILVVGFYVLWYRLGVRRGRTGDTLLSGEAVVLAAARPLFVMWIVFSFTYGYWYQPFYVVWPALLVAAARVRRRGLCSDAHRPPSGPVDERAPSHDGRDWQTKGGAQWQQAAGQTPDVSLCIPTWNAKDLLLDCVRSVAASAGRLSLEVIVVDNGSTDGTCEALAATFPRVIVLRNEVNEGFPFAVNRGLRLARGRYLVVLNNDVVVGPEALSDMVSTMDRDPSVGVLGCRVVFPDGSVQHTAHDEPVWQDYVYSALLLNRLFPQSRRFGRIDRTYLPYTPNLAIDTAWLGGVILVARRQAVEKAGLLDERIFAFSEDWDWCRRIGRSGFRVVYWARAQVVHHHGRSSTKFLGPGRERVRELSILRMTAAALYVFRKHHSSRLARALFGFGFRMHCLSRCIGYAVLGFVGPRLAQPGLARGYGKSSVTRYRVLASRYLRNPAEEASVAVRREA